MKGIGQLLPLRRLYLRLHWRYVYFGLKPLPLVTVYISQTKKYFPLYWYVCGANLNVY